MSNITRDLLPLAKPIDMFTSDPANARKHGERSYEVIANSLRQFGQRKPIVVQEKDGAFIVRAGNGTLEAAKLLGWEDIAAVIVNEDSVVSTAYALADNKTAEISEWDDYALQKQLAALMDEGVDMEDFGFDIDDFDPGIESSVEYTKKIEAPIYEPKGEKPAISSLVDTNKTKSLLDKIYASNLPEKEKEFLVLAAYRHNTFNYEAVAEFYAHADKETQELMEDSALVIIDFDKAIESGFVKLSEELAEAYSKNGK